MVAIMNGKALFSSTCILLLACAMLFSGCTTTLQTTATNATPDFSGCDFATTHMAIGVPINDQLTQERGIRIFCLYVPPGTDSVTVTLTGLSEDFDIYIHKTITEVEEFLFWWWSDKTGSADEGIVIENPDKDIFYVRVDSSYAVYGDFTLLATLGGGTTGNTTAVTTAVTTTVDAGGCDPRSAPFTQTDVWYDDSFDAGILGRTYCVQVPAGSHKLEVLLHSNTNDLDVIVSDNFDDITNHTPKWESTDGGMMEDVEIPTHNLLVITT